MSRPKTTAGGCSRARRLAASSKVHLSPLCTRQALQCVGRLPGEFELLCTPWHGIVSAAALSQPLCAPLPAAATAPCAGCTAAFDSVDKLDPENTQLMAAMWRYFSHDMEVINYWLANCVLPLETKQYPSRLVATAWHLAHNPNGKTAGFSGTKDNHRLLPMQVAQVPLVDAPQLQGTDGKMLGILLTHATYRTLSLGQVRAGASKQIWAPACMQDSSVRNLQE